MPCFSPLVGYRSAFVNDSGKRSIVFNRNHSLTGLPQQVPCGQCIGCRLERSRQWAIRCVHEASLFEHNCFITLTYDDDHLPDDRSLEMKHFQDFMKRLRKRFQGFQPVTLDEFDEDLGISVPVTRYPIRFYHCGEYGEKFRRPHYHAVLFNYDFLDKVFWKDVNGSKLFLSASLQDLWPHGFSTIGNVTFESAAYVARYIMKKVNGDLQENHYRVIDPSSGLVIDLKPEYSTMSRRPGIGKLWYNSFKDDVYPHDFLVMNGKKMKPPKFYDSQYEIENPDDYLLLKENRKISAMKYVDNNSYDRMIVREKCAKARLNLLIRNVE